MMFRKTLLACALALAALDPVAAQGADGHAGWPGAGQLFVGTNYQPFDRSREQIRRDIARMCGAGRTRPCGPAVRQPCPAPFCNGMRGTHDAGRAAPGVAPAASSPVPRGFRKARVRAAGS